MADSTTSGSTPGSPMTIAGDGPAPAKSWHRHFTHMRDPASAKNMCIEHFARSAGRLAYLEAKLQLSTDQQPLWNKWADATSAGNGTMRDDCIAAVPAKDTLKTALDRDSTIEKLLSDKLDALKTARPALEALYQSLTPEQRAAFDRSKSDPAVFTVAYVVRAVSPGKYVLPQAYVEDMYRPDRFGRTGTGTVEVSPVR